MSTREAQLSQFTVGTLKSTAQVFNAFVSLIEHTKFSSPLFSKVCLSFFFYIIPGKVQYRDFTVVSLRCATPSSPITLLIRCKTSSLQFTS